MFLPTGDTPNPRNFTAWVNWALIAANVLVYLLITWPLSAQAPDPNDPLLREYLEAVRRALPPGVSTRIQVSAYDLFVFAHGYKPAAPELSDLFASMFLHGGLLHLFGNMLFLWIYGDNVEHRVGRALYLVLYLATGAAATLAYALFEQASLLPLVGASGAISGVLGLYFLMFPRNLVKVFLFIWPFFFDVVLLPARVVLGFYVLVDNLLPVLLGSQTGVAYGAHLGGFLAGLGVAWAGEHVSWQWPWAERLGAPTRPRPVPRAEAPRMSRGNDALGELQRVIQAGDAEEALMTAAQMQRGELGALDARSCAMLADWMDEAGYPVAAARLLRLCVARQPRDPHLDEVLLRLGLLRLRQGQPTAAFQHLQAVFDHDPDADVAARAREALEQIDLYRRRPRG